jgi:Fe-S cluster assembly protein SufB
MKNLIKKFQINIPYKYGFKTKIKSNFFPKGLSNQIIHFLSKKKKEPEFILKFRLKAFKIWKTMKIPLWSNLSIKKINFQRIIYYSIPKIKLNLIKNTLDLKLLQTFKKLGILLTKKKNKNIAFDIIFDSLSIITLYFEKLSKLGIIFCSISDGIKYYPNLIKKFLGTVISSGDNFFSALNSIVFSDGSFCYIPQNKICPIDLSTYFRINNTKIGQFERTLIITEKNSYVNYIESCTAIKYSQNQLHAAIVELIIFKNSMIKYSTIQNWYSGNNNGIGGIYNFVTKRALALESNSTILWIQIENDSAIT